MTTNQSRTVSFFSWIAIGAIVLVCSQPILNAVSEWVETAAAGFPILEQLISLISVIPWFGEGAAVLLLVILKHAGVIAALAIYILINFTQIGLVGGPRERAIAYGIELGICLLSIPIYGSGFSDLVADFPDLDGELLNWFEVWKLFFSLFGPELAYGFLSSARHSSYYSRSKGY